MVTVREGEKKDIAVKVERTRGSGDITLVTPLRRILDSTHTLVAGFDWAACSWDDTNDELYTLFDSTAVGLTAVGTYYVQLKGTIGVEIYNGEVTVCVVDAGP